MRKSLLSAFLAGTAALAATPAAAQEAPPFSGVRVEGIVGYDTTDVDGENSDGVVYGVGVGYDFQVGGAVLGIEAEASDSTVDECFTDIDLVGDELCVQSGRDLYVGGRAGAVVGRSVLVYGKAGYTNGRVALAYQDGTSGTALDFEQGENLDGVRLGGGVEMAIGSNSFAKVEYRYSNYEQGFDRHQAVAGFGFRF